MLDSGTNLDAEKNLDAGPWTPALIDPEGGLKSHSTFKKVHTMNSGTEWDKGVAFSFDIYPKCKCQAILQTVLREKK